jgi:hypothetical protein
MGYCQSNLTSVQLQYSMQLRQAFLPPPDFMAHSHLQEAAYRKGDEEVSHDWRLH